MQLDEPYHNSRRQTERREATSLSYELQVHTMWSVPGRWLTRSYAKTTVNYLLMLKLCCDGYWDSCWYTVLYVLVNTWIVSQCSIASVLC